MKQITVKFIAVLIILISSAAVAKAQIVVKVRPAAPVLRARPVCPSPGHVWVGGNYAWRGGQYVYTNGYWAAARPGNRWIDGHWKHRRGGWVWVPGHWKRF